MSLLAAFALAFIPQGQAPDARLDAKIDYETVAVPVARALQEIGAKAGVRLETTPTLGNPVVVVRAADVPLKDLMAKLASVTSGEWKQEENGYRLARDAAAQNREANEERLAKLAAARKAIKQFVDAALKPPSPPGKEANVQAEFPPGLMGFGGAAGQAAIARLLTTIDPALISGLEDEGRVVFSTSPTRMQRPFSGNVAPVFTQLIAEHNKRTAGNALHFTVYGLLAWFTYKAARAGEASLKGAAAIALAFALVHAVFDETRQSLTLGRTGSPWDVLLDLAGMATFLALSIRRERRVLPS